MKHLNEIFTEQEFEALKKVKGSRTWRKLLLSLTDLKDVK